MKNKLEERERETERRLPGLIEDGRRSVELLGFSLWVRGEIFGEGSEKEADALNHFLFF